MKSVNVTAQLDRNRINKDEDYEGHLMVSLKASDPNFKRVPVDLCLVLDVSGSMGEPCHSGEAKYMAVREVAGRLVKNLTEQDRVSIVLFESHMSVALNNVSGSEKEKALAAIQTIRPGSGTNMSSGLLEGINQTGNGRFVGVKRILMLTDGHANEGVANRDGLLEIVGRMGDQKTTLSTFGFGVSCNHDLLADLAKKGGGNYHYVKNLKDCADVFAMELGGAASCIAQNIEVEVVPNKDNKVLEVLNDYEVEDRNGTALIRASDIYVDETKHVLIRMQLAKQPGAKDRPYSVAHLKVSYCFTDGTKKVEELNPKVEFVKADEADKEPILAVAEQVGLVKAAQAQVRAVDMANQGNYAGAQAEVKTAACFLQGLSDRGSEAAHEGVVCMSAALENFDQSTYDANYGTGLKGTARGMLRGKMGGAGGQTAGALNQGARYGNVAQRNMVAAMGGGLGPTLGGGPADPADLAEQAKFKQLPAGQLDKDLKEAEQKSFAKRRKQK